MTATSAAAVAAPELDPRDPPVWSDGFPLYCELCGEAIEREREISPAPYVLAHAACQDGAERRERARIRHRIANLRRLVALEKARPHRGASPDYLVRMGEKLGRLERALAALD